MLLPRDMQFCYPHEDTIVNKKQFQTSDFTQRPIPADQLLYARQDTHFLLYIYDRLKQMIAGRMSVPVKFTRFREHRKLPQQLKDYSPAPSPLKSSLSEPPLLPQIHETHHSVSIGADNYYDYGAYRDFDENESSEDGNYYSDKEDNSSYHGNTAESHTANLSHSRSPPSLPIPFLPPPPPSQPRFPSQQQNDSTNSSSASSFPFHQEEGAESSSISSPFSQDPEVASKFLATREVNYSTSMKMIEVVWSLARDVCSFSFIFIMF